MPIRYGRLKIKAIRNCSRQEARSGEETLRIYVVGTADTKGEELAFLAARVAEAGGVPLTADVGTRAAALQCAARAGGGGGGCSADRRGGRAGRGASVRRSGGRDCRVPPGRGGPRARYGRPR